MVRISKRMKEAAKVVEGGKQLSLDEAMQAVEKFPKVKFDETVELHFHLNIDPKSSDQMVRGTVSLPHGLGKEVRVAVFCKGEQAVAAKNAGADFVGDKELIEKVANGFLDFDSVIATPDMMRDISRLGRVLGPRGLMPSPKAGTVSQNVEKAVKEIKAGKVEFKSDKQSGIHVGIGKRSFSKAQLMDNAQQIIDAVNHVKPNSVKGNLVRSLSISTSMGPGITVNVS